MSYELFRMMNKLCFLFSLHWLQFAEQIWLKHFFYSLNIFMWYCHVCISWVQRCVVTGSNGLEFELWITKWFFDCIALIQTRARADYNLVWLQINCKNFLLTTPKNKNPFFNWKFNSLLRFKMTSDFLFYLFLNGDRIMLMLELCMIAISQWICKCRLRIFL